MKKLLLLLLGFGLMIGVGSATTYTLTPYSTPTSQMGTNQVIGEALRCTLSNCSLTKVNVPADMTCRDWFFLTYTGLLLGTGKISGNSGILNMPMTGAKVYLLLFGSGTRGGTPTICTHRSLNNGFLNIYGRNFTLLSGQYIDIVIAAKSNNLSTVNFMNTSVRYDISSLEYSGIIYGPPAPPPTIHYNGTTTGFAGSDIYLSGQAGYELSGSIFTNTGVIPLGAVNVYWGTSSYLNWSGDIFLSGNMVYGSIDFDGINTFTYNWNGGNPPPVGSGYLGFTGNVEISGDYIGNFGRNLVEIFYSNIPAFLQISAVCLVILFLVVILFRKHIRGKNSF